MGIQVNSNEPISVQPIKLPLCPRCKTELDSRVPRGFFVKNLLFFLPIKRYLCYKCQRKRYILHN